MTARALLALLVVVGVPAAPAMAFQAEVARYHRVVADVCTTGITPTMRAAYEDARQAVERARYGSGHDGNFWGLKTPEGFWLDCFQSDGKT